MAKKGQYTSNFIDLTSNHFNNKYIIKSIRDTQDIDNLQAIKHALNFQSLINRQAPNYNN